MRDAAPARMRQNLRNVVVIVVTTAVILLGLWLVKGPWRTGAGDTDGQGVTAVDVNIPAGQQAPAVGQPAPDFTAVTVTGQTVTLSGLRGQPVWLVFGATWCTDCRVEAPDIQALSQTYAGRVQVVAVYVGEQTSAVQAYAQRIGLTYPQIADAANSIAAAYAIMGIPAHFFLDADGVIRKIAVGTISAASASSELNALIAA